MSCEEHKLVFTEGLQPHEILALTAPRNSTVWEGRDNVWDVIFYIYIAVFAALFLALGVIATLLLIKRDCIRLKNKLFFTIYSFIAILGYSRAVWLVLDPNGMIGFIGDVFNGWFIISELIRALGFPSLDASYSLMMLALLKVSTKPSEPWHYKWEIIVSVVLAIFAIVFTAEIISLTAPYPGVIAVVVCQYLVAIGGIVFCVLFFTVGNRLLRKLNHLERRSVRFSDASAYSPNTASAQNFASRELQRHQAKTRRTKRKIVIITYATAIFSIVYSLIIVSRAILTTHLLFGSCLGYEDQRGSSAAWLAMEVMQKTTEMVLGLVLLYSVTDLSAFINIVSCQRYASV